MSAISLSCSIPPPQARARVFWQHFQTTRQVFRRGIQGDIKDNARRLTPHDLKTSRQGSLRNTVANLSVIVQPGWRAARPERAAAFGWGTQATAVRQRAVAIGKRPLGRCCHLITPVNAATPQQRAGLLRDIMMVAGISGSPTIAGFSGTKNLGFLFAYDTSRSGPSQSVWSSDAAGNYRYIGIHNTSVRAPAQPDLQNHSPVL